MTKLYYGALTSMILGLAGGLFYRELTKAQEFTGATQLAVVHTHLLTLGTLFFLLVLLLDRAFGLSRSRLFGWFFWVYTGGLALTTAMQVVHGTMTVLGQQTGAAVAGIAGLGHVGLTAGLVLLFVCLRGRMVSREPVAVGA